jgi:predicted permease
MNDLKFALRQLLKNPGFTAVVVLTLALGIGANTAIVSFIDRVFLRPLRVEKPNELVMVKYRRDTGSTDDSFIHPLYLSLRDQSRVFSGLVAYWGIMADLNVGNTARQVMGLAVSGNYFSVLGVKPDLGRGFLPEEDQTPGTHPVAVISHELWQRQFNGDPAVLGQTLRLNDYSLTIVGVAPAEFTGTYAGTGPALYVPLSVWAHMNGIALDKREYDWLKLLGRLEPGISREQAQAGLRVLAEQIHAVEPINTPTEIILTDGSRGTNVWGEKNLWWPFALLQAITAMILLIACANVTNLLLARGTTRQKEMAIRVAVGASRGAVIRQLLVESTLLALLSGACGVLLALWLTHLLRGAIPIADLLSIPVGMDGRVLAFALAASLATALVCGLAPALRASRPGLVAALNDGAGRVRMLTRRWSLRNLLVVVQVAVTLVVLAVGALCIRSLGKLRMADPGFDASRLVAVSVDLGRGPGRNAEAHRVLTDLRERVAAFPGVQSVSLASRVPLSEGGRNKTGAKRIDNFQIPSGEEFVSWEYTLVGPGYFQTLGVPLVRGRDFTPQDGPGAPKVMIVNELMAQQYWPNQDAIGKRVTLGWDEVREVVGVVQAVKLHSIREEPIPMSFWPLAQPMEVKSLPPALQAAYAVRPVMLVRLAGDPKAVVSLVRKELESTGVPPTACDVRTLTERLSDLLAPQRMIGGILNVFGLVGLLFAATGVFGVMAYEVNQRTREIGIRMALGAQWGDVLEVIVRKGAILTLAGLGLGLVVSAVPIALLEAFMPEIRQTDQYFLYGVHAWDPLTYAVAALVVGLAALAACWLPARRAARVDPMVALRHE